MKAYRNEWKYLADKEELLSVFEGVKSVMQVDSFANQEGWYKVHSIYFDDIYDSCVRKNISGDGVRHKYRIRYYNYSLDRVVLERKEKLNSYCHKRSCVLTTNELENILEKNVEELLWQEDKIKKEFAIDILNRGYAPKANISYTRFAFVEPISNVRITFDTELMVNNAYEFDDLNKSHIDHKLIKDNQAILEVKFDYILPSYIKQIVQSKKFDQQAFSKYYMGRKILNTLIV